MPILGVIAHQNKLHAEIAILHFTPERADLVRRLNQAGIPVIAWMLLPKEDGSYLDADNASATAARVAALEEWTRESHLKWDAVGLDIEPNLAELAALKNHHLRLITTLLQRSLDGSRIARARPAYSKIIAEIQSRGYPVQTYQGCPIFPQSAAPIPRSWIGCSAQ